MFFGILYSFSRAPWGNLHNTNPQHSYINQHGSSTWNDQLSVSISLLHDNTQRCFHSNIKFNSSDMMQK